MAEVEAKDNLHHRSVRGRWDYIRQKLKRRGVVDVDASHPHFNMLKCIRTGIEDLLLNHKELGPKACATVVYGPHPACDLVLSGIRCGSQVRLKIAIQPAPWRKFHMPDVDNLHTEDYHQVLSKTLQLENGKSFVFESYACCVFASLRRAVDISEEDYLMSLVPPGLPYLEFISNSRSGQDFYFSNNQRFILKTDREHCIHYFQSILRDYIEHFHAYPHSLLVKFLGLYMIQMSGRGKKYILVMQSAFYPPARIQERFDLKGCFCGRYQKPNPPGKKTILVLKDQNFIGDKIDLGTQKEWFLHQVKADVDFLHELGVGDYSLLVGRHPLHGSERRETLDNLVSRIQISSYDAVSTSHARSSESTNINFGSSHDAISTSHAYSSESTNINVRSSLDAVSTSHAHSSESTNINFRSSHDAVSTSHTHSTESTALPKDHSADAVSIPGEVEMVLSPSQSSSQIRKNRSHVVRIISLTSSSVLGSPAQNRRLLPNCLNNLHIIDGMDHRYYLGIIDFFTLFQCRQRFGKFFKDIKHCCKEHSTEPPDVYADRFYKFIAEITT